MTGRHEFKNGVTHTLMERERMTLDAVTLAQVLKRAGYTTGTFGKWHLGDEEPYQPHNRGFDEVFIHGAGGIGQTYPGSCGDAPTTRILTPPSATTADSRRPRATAPTGSSRRRSSGWGREPTGTRRSSPTLRPTPRTGRWSAPGRSTTRSTKGSPSTERSSAKMKLPITR